MPGNTLSSTDKYSLQIAVSYPLRDGFFGRPGPITAPATNAERIDLIKEFARTWAEPFRSVVLDIPEDTEVKPVALTDWVPPQGLRGSGRVTLLGDALHAMVMCM